MRREIRHLALFVLNAVLTAAVVALVLHASQRPPTPPAREVGPGKMTKAPPAETAEKTQNSTGRPKLTQYMDIASASDRRRWLIDQLRAAGVPNDVLARVAWSDFEAGWQTRLEACGGDAEAMAALQSQQELDADTEMRAALGAEGFQRWDQENMLREANVGKLPLTASETNAVYDLKKQLQQRQRELARARLKGDMDDAEVNDASGQAWAEFNQGMKTLLGEDRYAKSQGLDAGAAAANLRQELARVNPSGSQFQDLLQAQQQLNDARSALDQQFQDAPSSPDYAAQIKALDDARDQEYQRVLGTNGFDTLQKAQDDSYARMKKYANIWGLDDAKMDSVYGALKFYQKSVQDYQAQASALQAQGQSVDWDAVNQNLQQFDEQTRQSLQNYLGRDNFARMQRNGIFPFPQPGLTAGRGF